MIDDVTLTWDGSTRTVSYPTTVAQTDLVYTFVYRVNLVGQYGQSVYKEFTITITVPDQCFDIDIQSTLSTYTYPTPDGATHTYDAATYVTYNSPCDNFRYSLAAGSSTSLSIDLNTGIITFPTDVQQQTVFGYGLVVTAHDYNDVDVVVTFASLSIIVPNWCQEAFVTSNWNSDAYTTMMPPDGYLGIREATMTLACDTVVYTITNQVGLPFGKSITIENNNVVRYPRKPVDITYTFDLIATYTGSIGGFYGTVVRTIG